MPDRSPAPRPVLATGIPGLDRICGGGLPAGAVTLLAGTSGSGKSVLGAQFLAAGIRDAHEAGVLVTLEERPEKIRRFMTSLGWDVAGWEAQGSWAFFDGSPGPDREIVVGEGAVDLTSLISRIAAVVTRVGAKRVVIDSVSEALIRVGDRPRVRSELGRLVGSMEALGVTTIVTAERDDEEGAVSRFGVEQFVTDNILILRNVLEDGTRRRTVEALKFRGTPHLTGEFPYAILPTEGMVIASVAEIELAHPAPSARLSFGNPDVDAMCGGGALQGSVVVVSGPTGVGKSLLAVEFAKAAAADGGRTLMVCFEESREQVLRNAAACGHDLEALERTGHVRLLCQYPESAPVAMHLIGIQQVVDELAPTRVVVDSLSGVERASTPRAFREFLLGLASSLKDRRVTTLLTTTTPWLLGGPSATGIDASTLIDSIILLRYVEVRGELHRGMSVLKMRGSDHTKAIREYVITDHGLTFGTTFPAVTGVLAGQPLLAEGGASAP